jgi:hypothetical protein
MDDATAAMTPDERVAAGLCPECGVIMTGQKSDTHGLTHWPSNIFPDGRNQEAIRRQQLLHGMTTTLLAPHSPPHGHESASSSAPKATPAR